MFTTSIRIRYFDPYCLLQFVLTTSTQLHYINLYYLLEFVLSISFVVASSIRSSNRNPYVLYVSQHLSHCAAAIPIRTRCRNPYQLSQSVTFPIRNSSSISSCSTSELCHLKNSSQSVQLSLLRPASHLPGLSPPGATTQ